MLKAEDISLYFTAKAIVQARGFRIKTDLSFDSDALLGQDLLKTLFEGLENLNYQNDSIRFDVTGTMSGTFRLAAFTSI